ncbi:UNVERIFIED_CONTAM: hypothetical protein FKN15_017706 [Acipenser sinensis]
MVWVFIMNRVSSQSSSSAQRRRMALGIVMLLLVDVIWVASSELTSYIFKRQDYNKPFFSTFAKTSMFILYLVGFLVWKPWRQQCARGFRGRHAALFSDAEGYFTACTTDNSFNNSLSEPLYVPVKFQDVPSEKVGDANGECEEYDPIQIGEVPVEVYSLGIAAPNKPVLEVSRLHGVENGQWFLANFSYQEALSDTQVAIVNILSSTSGLFTLILAAVFPSNSGDRFTLSKLLAVALSGFEAFELPSKLVWMYLILNGLIGTVLSEFLWLWGCFLTSSLIGTLALSLTIPLSIIADMCMQKVRFSWLFFAGAVPVFLSFFIVTILCHYNNWDPVMVGVRRVFAFICRKHRIQRTLEGTRVGWGICSSYFNKLKRCPVLHRTSEDSEQCESLIPMHGVSQDDGPSCCS